MLLFWHLRGHEGQMVLMLPEKGAPQKAKAHTTSWPLASTYAFMICSAKSPPWLEAHEAHWYERRTILDMRERKKVHVEFHQQKLIKDWYFINTFAFENKIIMRLQIRFPFGHCLVMYQAQWAAKLRFYVYVLSFQFQCLKDAWVQALPH